MVFSCLGETDLVKVLSDRGQSNRDSLADRSLGPVSATYEAFCAALRGSLDSPALADALPGDYIHTSQGMPGGDFRAVVKMPRLDGSVCNVPTLSATDGEANWRTLSDFFEFIAEGQDADNNPFGPCGRIVFPANQVIPLRNPSNPSGAHLNIELLTDTEIDFNGCILILEQVGGGIVIEDCQRLHMTNGTLRALNIGSSAAIVRADTGSPTGIRFEVVPEFHSTLASQYGTQVPLRTIGYARTKAGGGWEYDALGSADIFANRSAGVDRWEWDEATKSFVATSAANPDLGPLEECFPIGRLVYLLHENNSAHGIVLKTETLNMEDITFTRMTLQNINGMGILGDLRRGVRVDNCIIEPDPNNPLSMWGSTSDAVHFNNHGKDIVVINNKIGPSADDLTTCKGNWWAIEFIDAANNAVIVNNVGEKNYGVNAWGEAGNGFVGIDCDFNVLFQHTQVATAQEGNFLTPTFDAPNPCIGKNKCHTVYLDSVSGLQVGMLVANPTLAQGGVVIGNNEYAGSRAQGTLVQTQHVDIFNNSYTNIAGPGVEINFALKEWYEGVKTGNIRVADCLFDQVAVARTKPSNAIDIHQEGCDGADATGVIEHVLLSNNAWADPAVHSLEDLPCPGTADGSQGITSSATGAGQGTDTGGGTGGGGGGGGGVDPMPNDYVPPTSFTEIQLTNNPAGTALGDAVMHQYSTKPAFNADCSTIFLPRNGPVLVDLQGNPLSPAPPFGGEYTCSITDPDLIYGLRGGQVQVWDRSTGNTTSLISVPGATSFGGSEGQVMQDRYVVLDAGSDLVSVDLQTGSELGRIGKPADYDWAGFCCSGDWIVVRINPTGKTFDELVRYNPDFTQPFQLWDDSRHSAFTIDANGDDVVVSVGVPIRVHRIRDGMLDSSAGDGGFGHLSGCATVPGVVGYSIGTDVGTWQIGTPWADRIIFAQHGSAGGEASGPDYLAQPHANLAPDALKIIYRSDRSGTVQDYVVTGTA